MVGNVVFFWVLPIIFGLITFVFGAITRFEAKLGSARMGAMAFGIACLAMLLDTQRSIFPWWFFSLAVPLHWAVLLCIFNAFLMRHNDRIPVRPALALCAVGLAINFWATFIDNNVLIRVPNASIVATLLAGMGVWRLFQHRKRALDHVIAWGHFAAFLCYAVRTLVWLTFDQATEYAHASQFSSYMTIFYFSTAVLGISIAFLLILTITVDLVERNQRASTIDALTGVWNRRGLDKLIEKNGNSRQFGAVIMLDLDHFKTINDSFGHDTGDAVLEATGALLTHHCAAFGPVVRMGGEEFAILVYASHTEATEHLAHLLRTAIAALRLPCLPEGRQITASIGVAKLAPSETERDAIRRADDALYAAKNGGRDRVEFAAPVGNFALSA